MAEDVIESYKSSLADLTFNSKPLINMLTMLAEDHEQQATLIIQAIEQHLEQVKTCYKLPVLYLIDSIIKNLKSSLYPKLFAQCIENIFVSVFEEVDEKTRQAMFKLRQTWKEIIPNKRLYGIDVRVNLLDPAWPITAQPQDQVNIHVNPKFLLQMQQQQQHGEDKLSLGRFSPPQASPPQQDEEDLMRQQLLAKEQELQKLKLELELAETKAKLELQRKQLEEKQQAQQQQIQSLKSKVHPKPRHVTPTSVSVPVSPAPLPDATAVPARTEPQKTQPVKRDPRLASRDPRRATRDPRLAQNNAAPSGTPNTKSPNLVSDTSSVLFSSASVTTVSAPPSHSAPVIGTTGKNNKAPSLPVKQEPKIKNDSKSKSSKSPEGHKSSPGKKENSTVQKSQSKKGDGDKKSEITDKHKDSEKDSRRKRDAEKSSKSDNKDHRPKEGQTKDSRKSRSTSPREKKERNSKELSDTKSRHVDRKPDEKRERSEWRSGDEDHSRRSPRRQTSRADEHFQGRYGRRGRGHGGYRPRHEGEKNTSRRDSDRRRNSRDDTEREPRRSRSPVHERSPQRRGKDRNQNNQKTGQPGDIHLVGDINTDSRLPNNEVSKRSAFPLLPIVAPSTTEMPLDQLLPLDTDARPQGKSVRPAKRNSAQMDIDERDLLTTESEHGPSDMKRARINQEDKPPKINTEETLSDLFGAEDVDYRVMAPLQSPVHEGWSKFKANHPDEFLHETERRKCRESKTDGFQDIDLRRRSIGNQPRPPLLNNKQMPQFIPQALQLQNQEDILKQADLQLRAGLLSHEQHQDLLKQLTTVYDLQRDRQIVSGRGDPRLFSHDGQAKVSESRGAPVDIDHRKIAPSDTDIRNKILESPVKRLASMDIDSRQKDIDSRQKDTDKRLKDVDTRLNDADSRQKNVDLKQQDTVARHRETDVRKRDIDARHMTDVQSKDVGVRKPVDIGIRSLMDIDLDERQPVDFDVRKPTEGGIRNLMDIDLDARQPMDADVMRKPIEGGIRKLMDIDVRKPKDFDIRAVDSDIRPGRKSPHFPAEDSDLRHRSPETDFGDSDLRHRSPRPDYEDRFGSLPQHFPPGHHKRLGPRNSLPHQNDKMLGPRYHDMPPRGFLGRPDMPGPRHQNSNRPLSRFQHPHGATDVRDQRPQFPCPNQDPHQRHPHFVQNIPILPPLHYQEHPTDPQLPGQGNFINQQMQPGLRPLPGAHEDPRWTTMQRMLGSEANEEVVIDRKPYEISVGGSSRSVRIAGHHYDIFADPVQRAVCIDRIVVYKFGELVKDVEIGGKWCKLFYHGKQRLIWIDGRQHEIRVDAPPRKIAIDGKLYGFQLDGRDMMILVDRLEKGTYGGPPRQISIDGVNHEIRFDPPPRQILIDGQNCELKLDRRIPVVIYNGKPHGIRFDGPPRDIIIDDFRFSVPMDRAVRVRIKNRPHFLAFGGPAHEIIVDGKWYEVKFDNVPKEVVISNTTHTVRLEGPTPSVIIMDEIHDMEGGIPNGPGQQEYVPEGIRFPGPKPGIKVGIMPDHRGPAPRLQGPGPQLDIFLQGPNQPVPQPLIPEQMPVRQGGGNMTGPGEMQILDVSHPVGVQIGSGQMPIQPQVPGSMVQQAFPQTQIPGTLGMGPMFPQTGLPVSQPLLQPSVGLPNLFSSFMAPAALAPATPQPGGSLDVGSLFQKLVAAGIIPKSDTADDSKPKKDEAQGKEKQDDVKSQFVAPEEKEVVEKIPSLSLSSIGDLKKLYKGVIQHLYQGIQCSSCGTRFSLEQTERYREHLDWHFRQNKRGKNEVRVARNRNWYYKLNEWIQYEEIGDSEDKGRSHIFEKMLQTAPSHASEQMSLFIPQGSNITQCPAASGNNDDICCICGDPFEQYWNEDEEEWHLRDAVRVDNKTYHPVCFEDAREEGSVLEPTPTPTPVRTPSVNPLIAQIRVEGVPTTPPEIKQEDPGVPQLPAIVKTEPKVEVIPDKAGDRTPNESATKEAGVVKPTPLIYQTEQPKTESEVKSDEFSKTVKEEKQSEDGKTSNGDVSQDSNLPITKEGVVKPNQEPVD